MRRPPSPWRVGRLFLAFGLVLTGLIGILTVLAFFWWPGILIVFFLAILITGGYFVSIEPREPRQPE